MAEKIFNVRIVQKHNTEAEWLKAVDFIPKQGEIIIYDKDNNYSYERIKIGDGATKVSSLPFVHGAVESVNGQTGVINLTAKDINALPADTIIPSVEGLATETYVNNQISDLSAEIDEKINISDIIDNVLSTDTTKPLSAAQGKYLNDRISSITGNMEDLGGGDMMKATYDADGNGIIDNAERLGGNLPSYYAPATALEELKNLVNNFKSLGTNPIDTSTNDTTTKWSELGSGYAYFNASNKLINQPAQYGTLVSFVNGNFIFQIFSVNSTTGHIYIRYGNSSGWRYNWKKITSNDDFTYDSETKTLSIAL